MLFSIICCGTQILPYLYDKEVVSEDAILRWAEEKENADESDKVFVKQSDAFIQVYICELRSLFSFAQDLQNQ